MIRTGVYTALAALALACSSGAMAQDIGDTVSCEVTGGGTFTCFESTATIDSGTEFNIGNSPTAFLGADFGDDTLFINALLNSSLGATVLNFSDLSSPITSFLLVSSSGFAGFDASDLSLTGGVLTIDLRGTDNTQGGQIALQLSSAGAVPEPATWAMMLIGFGAVGFGLRRQRKAAGVAQLA